MKSVIQIAPAIATGSGAESVAFNLEQAFIAAGVPTERFTMVEARGDWLPRPKGGLSGKAALTLRVIWFSTVGTLLARRFLAQRKESVSICHNDVLAGDVYVNHGILKVAMRARGRYAFRMLRNPLHLFTAVRDALRYRSSIHRAIVSLTDQERRLLQRAYPHIQLRSVVIGNGVDIEHFRPPSLQERQEARHTLLLGGSLPEESVAVAFVGHEFDRKGLPLAIKALVRAPSVIHLLVAGGTEDMVRSARERAERFGVSNRVHFLGKLADARLAFWAADALILPSSYESYGLVVLEAMACGVPVLVTATGCVPDIVIDGQSGWIIERTTDSIVHRLHDLIGADREAMSRRARDAAAAHGWSKIAAAYVELLEAI